MIESVSYTELDGKSSTGEAALTLPVDSIPVIEGKRYLRGWKFSDLG